MQPRSQCFWERDRPLSRKLSFHFSTLKRSDLFLPFFLSPIFMWIIFQSSSAQKGGNGGKMWELFLCGSFPTRLSLLVPCLR